MKSDAVPVAVVGGGFSGVMTAVQLARRGIPSLLFDGSGRMGRGVAYSTREPAHLLNVPSGKMSAWPDRPDDFAAWLGDDGTSFAERRRFGAYLQEILRGTEGVTCIEATVAGAERNSEGFSILLANGRTAEVSAMVLANGNQPPSRMAVAADLPADRFVNNPWGSEAAEAIRRTASSTGDVLLLGTGLTMIDTVLSLQAAGHRGRITTLSRRGLVPRSHAAHEPRSVGVDELPGTDLSSLWQWVRRRSGEVGFRAAVDSLRPHSQAIWQGFSRPDRQRFLRHARPWWDVHRHRIAPEVARQLSLLISDGRLQVMAGRVRELRATDDGLAATIARRGGALEERSYTAAFNCTGPLGEMRRTEDPLIRQLLDEQRIGIDDLGMGIAVEQPGRAGDRIWAVGPMTKGAYWEIVAVPDIRGQAAAVADDISRELGA